MIELPKPARFGLCAIAMISIIALANAPVSADFNQRVLDAHNAERARLGLEPLRWNSQLAATAGGWATRLADMRAFEHAPENVRAPEGENLWEGTKGYFSPEAMVDAWAREKKYFKLGLVPENSKTGEFRDVGHYTQLMWRETSDVGCAIASNATDDVLVCRYWPAGNYVGQKPF